jgi:hypothetical protein
MFDLRSTLTAYQKAGGLPSGFTINDSVRALFPVNALPASISELRKYHYTFQDSLKAVGTTCNITVEAWGNGNWSLTGYANNVDWVWAFYNVAFAFNFSPGNNVYGFGVSRPIGPRSSDGFSTSGTDSWILENWPHALSPTSSVSDYLHVSDGLPQDWKDTINTIFGYVAEGAGVFLMLFTGGCVHVEFGGGQTTVTNQCGQQQSYSAG